MERILNQIYLQLSNLPLEKLPYCLQGKTGIMLFLALYSEWKDHLHARSLAKKLLISIIKNTSHLQPLFFNGSWGVLWALQYLKKQGILENDQTISQFIQQLRNMNYAAQIAMPIKLMPKDVLFSEGICTLYQWKDDNSLERYIVEEHLINLIDDCKRLLSLDYPNIYYPNYMPISLLHSITWYLQKMVTLKLYPYHAEQLLKEITSTSSKYLNNDNVDSYILGNLLSDSRNGLTHETKLNNCIDTIGKAGFYSILYNRSDLFNKLWKPVEINNEMPISVLCGIGLGILQTKMNR